MARATYVTAAGSEFETALSEIALLDANAVLSTTSLVAAGSEAVRRQAFGENNDLAPLASDTHVRSKPRNPLIVAITLTGLHGRFSLGEGLGIDDALRHTVDLADTARSVVSYAGAWGLVRHTLPARATTREPWELDF